MKENIEIEGRVIFDCNPKSEIGSKILEFLKQTLPGKKKRIITGRDCYFDFDENLRRRELKIFDIEKNRYFEIDRMEKKFLEELKRGKYGTRALREIEGINISCSSSPRFYIEGKRIEKISKYNGKNISLCLDEILSLGKIGVEYEISTNDFANIDENISLLENYVENCLLKIFENVEKKFDRNYHFEHLTYQEIFRRRKYVPV